MRLRKYITIAGGIEWFNENFYGNTIQSSKKGFFSSAKIDNVTLIQKYMRNTDAIFKFYFQISPLNIFGAPIADLSPEYILPLPLLSKMFFFSLSHFINFYQDITSVPILSMVWQFFISHLFSLIL